MSISIVALRNSVAANWALDFKTSVGKYVGFSLDQRTQIADIYKELSETSGRNKRSAGLADVVTLGDAWLGPAIRQRLLQPIPGAQRSRWYRMLPPRLRALVRRNELGQYDPAGQVYGAPYRWGCTLVAYKRNRLKKSGGRPLLDWLDLLQPALAGRVGMVDSPRELVAVALRSLGLSANAGPAQLAAAGVSEEQLAERVAAFRRQVKVFSNNEHVRALLAGDVWALVGYSQDLVTLAERGFDLDLLAPLSGTQLWADVWAVPAGAKGGHMQRSFSPLLPAWIEFSLSAGRITGQPGLKSGAPSIIMPAHLPPSTPNSAVAGDVLDAIHQHREHILSTRAWDETALERVLRGLRLRPGVAERRQQQHDGQHADGSGDSAAAGAAVSSGSGESFSNVLLMHRNGYLPPASVLSRSEFLLPLDDEQQRLYRNALQPPPPGAAPLPAR